MRMSILIGMFISQLFMLPLATSVYAEEGDSCERTSDCDEGERCKDNECVPKKKKSGAGKGGQQLYCCDVYGRKWCPMPPNAGIEGGVCYCQGVPGSGFQCR